ncbi:YHS domain-containing protein [Tabrizicola piscis]|uniref:YHS domain-containing protein n=1 Tax=Tabrizicola piscis TaxID=2494374 RepID=A0A3S8U4N5_9RHOB|nr:YHS domain-containing (seleno)protein [Tabrizicola piscis]AZL58574.1 YHS domain-containing protein [Tabrizicola piscis]
MIHFRPLTLRMTAILLGLATPMAAFAEDEHFLTEGTAANGYDVVAYHTVGAPTPGDAAYTADYQGVTWSFASAENRDMFAADPAKYAPAYGGWCSAGASKGKKVPTLPEFFAIVDGQLYLNSSEKAHKDLFLKDTATVIDKGESNWKRIYATEADKL